MPLPLLSRKSLRDNQENLDENVEKIKSALGVEWTFEFDWDVLLVGCEESLKHDCGAFFYKEIAGAIARNIEECAKDEMLKEALVEANTNCKITMIPNPDKKDYTYWKYRFEAGNLQILYKQVNCNISDLQYFKLSSVIPTPGVYSLNARLNLKKNKERFDEALEMIKETTKNDWTYDEASLEEVYPLLESKDTQERIGDCFADVITSIAHNIKGRCADDMVLEAFNEAIPNSKIVFKCNKKQSEYWLWTFADGNLVVSFKTMANVSDVQYFNFEKLL